MMSLETDMLQKRCAQSTVEWGEAVSTSVILSVSLRQPWAPPSGCCHPRPISTTCPLTLPLAYLGGTQSEGGTQPPGLLARPWCQKEALQAPSCSVGQICPGTGPRHRIQSRWSLALLPQTGDLCWASGRSRPQGSALWEEKGETDTDLLCTSPLSTCWLPDPTQDTGSSRVATSPGVRARWIWVCVLASLLSDCGPLSKPLDLPNLSLLICK